MTPRQLVLLASATALCACATPQENPNYRFSSKYQAPQAAPVQLASTTPVPVQTLSTDTVVVMDAPVSAVSETEQAWDARTMDGTPGYVAVMEAEAEHDGPAPAPIARPVEITPTPGPSQGPRAVSYDYSQNVIIAGADTQVPSHETRPRGLEGAYVVQPGDTVYSLARARCLSIADVQQGNRIGADYAIAIGQTLSLPPSRC